MNQTVINEDSKDPDPLKKHHILNYNLNNRKRCQDLFYVLMKNITIEPSILFFAITYMMTFIATQNLSLEKACRVNLNLTDKICTTLRRQEIKGQNEYEGETHKLLASAVTWRSYLVSSVPGIMSLFVGAWSDKTGRRKIFLAVGIIGQIVISMNNLIQTYFLNELDINFLTLCEAIIYSLAGGWCFYLLASFSYISSITNKETRTFRIGVFNFCHTVGNPIGAALGGIILKNFGYYGCYGLTLLIQTINLLYIMCIVKDPRRNAEQKQHDSKGVWHCLRIFFNYSIVKQILSVIVKKRPNNRKLLILLLLPMVIVIFGPYYSEHKFLYMMTRYRFHWDELQFGLFQTYNTVVHTIGTITSLTLFSKIWKWNDSLMGILSGLCKIAGSILFCFASNGYIFYLGTLLDIFSGIALLILKSIISKTVNADEIGRAMSLITLIENLSPLMFVPLYSKIYIATMEVMAGALHIVGAVAVVPAIVVFSWIFYEHKLALRKPVMQNEVEIPLNN